MRRSRPESRSKGKGGILAVLELEIAEYYERRSASLADLRNAEGESLNVLLNCLEK